MSPSVPSLRFPVLGNRYGRPRFRRCRTIAAILSLSIYSGLQPDSSLAQDLGSSRPDAATPSSFLSFSASKRHEKITLAVGKALIVDLPEDATEVFVGNPSVANAVVRSARRLYVMAIGKGPTTIVAMNKSGGPLATLEINVTARDLAELDAILAAAIPGNDIHTQQIDNTIILTGSVASALEAQRAQDIANGFVGYTAETGGGGATSSGSGSSVSFGSSPVIVGGGAPINSLVIRGQDQVMLKVSVVEVERSVVKQLGITTNGTFGSTNVFNYAAPSAASVPGGSLIPTPTGITAAGSGTGISGKYGSLTAALQAYERNGVARVLAEPTVTAISGESALFTAGGSIPISNTSSYDPKTGICTIQTVLQNYGVTLNFTPTVLSEGRISLHIATEVTEPDGTAAAPYACSNQVGFRTRKNTTTVELPSGGSIVSAGLIQENSTQAVSGTPGLMNLPILGALFRSRDYQRNESELMIVVTPYLTKSIRTDQISKPDDGFSDPSDPQSWLLGRVNRIYSTANNPELVKNYKGKVGFIAD